MLPDTEPSLTSLRERYLAARLAGNRREALRLLVDEGLLRGVPVQVLHLEVIQLAQYEIGRLWQENIISVAQEHLATPISQLALAHAREALPSVPIAVGGLAFRWAPVLEQELGVSFFGKDARELVASACRTLGV